MLKFISFSFDNSMYMPLNVIFNSENPAWCELLFSYGWKRYKEMLEESAMIWTYSYLSNEVFQTHFPNRQIAVLSYSYSPGRSNLLQNEYQITEKATPYNMDTLPDNIQVAYVFFYGIWTQRRETILGVLKANMSEAYATILREGRTDTLAPYFFNFMDFFISDYVRDYYIIKADILLNINTMPSSSLEIHRINYFLSLGKVVISEKGADPNLVSKYAHIVIFVDSTEEMLERIYELTNNSTKLEEAKVRVREHYDDIEEMYRGELKEAMRLTKAALDEKLMTL